MHVGEKFVHDGVEYLFLGKRGNGRLKVLRLGATKSQLIQDPESQKNEAEGQVRRLGVAKRTGKRQEVETRRIKAIQRSEDVTRSVTAVLPSRNLDRAKMLSLARVISLGIMHPSPLINVVLADLFEWGARLGVGAAEDQVREVLRMERRVSLCDHLAGVHGISVRPRSALFATIPRNVERCREIVDSLLLLASASNGNEIYRNAVMEAYNAEVAATARADRRESKPESPERG